MLAAIERGLIQRQIQDAAYIAQQAIDRGDTDGRRRQRLRRQRQPADSALLGRSRRSKRASDSPFADLRSRRNATSCGHALAEVSAAAQEGRNLVPPIIAAAHARATLGEIADAMRAVFGEHTGDAA